MSAMGGRWAIGAAFLAVAISGAELGCVATEVTVPARSVVERGAPPALNEAPSPAQPPSPNQTWIAGYWHWTGMRYTWIPGHWESAPPAF
jgi:hypothetical protein